VAQSIITLACPSCGANLDLKPGVEQITCAFCGKAAFVNRGDDTLSLEPSGQSSDRPGTTDQREQTQKAAPPAQKPEAVQEDPRVRERLADQSLLPRVEQERIAAEEIVAQDSRRLSRLRSNVYSNRFLGFASLGCALLFAACVTTAIPGTISRGIDGKSSPSDTIGQVFVALCMSGTSLAIGIFVLWLLRSAARRQSAQIQELEQQDQVTRSELTRLREQEAQMRRRLAG
jgi:LSD1 subclass zinc finger protein